MQTILHNDRPGSRRVRDDADLRPYADEVSATNTPSELLIVHARTSLPPIPLVETHMGVDETARPVHKGHMPSRTALNVVALCANSSSELGELPTTASTTYSTPETTGPTLLNSETAHLLIDAGCTPLTKNERWPSRKRLTTTDSTAPLVRDGCHARVIATVLLQVA